MHLDLALTCPNRTALIIAPVKLHRVPNLHGLQLFSQRRKHRE